MVKSGRRRWKEVQGGMSRGRGTKTELMVELLAAVVCGDFEEAKIERAGRVACGEEDLNERDEDEEVKRRRYYNASRGDDRFLVR